MRRLHTVRAGYLYIICGSLLLSGGVLLTLRGAAAFLYSRHTADSGAFLIRLLRWMINHIGRLPLSVIIFTAASVAFFLLRSQILSDDIKAVVQASEELVTTGTTRELKVSTGGELGRLAANLREISLRKEMVTNNRSGPESALPQETDLDSEESMALILRMKTLLRLLDELEDSGGSPLLLQVEEIKREMAGLERFLENLIARC